MILTLVSLRARICGCTTGDRPLERPVSVDIATDARVAADSLAVLAPKAVRRLGVDEAIWIYHGCDVEVELVNHGGDGGGRPVLGQERVRNILCSLGSDPFACMDVSVEDDGGPGALATATPDVDASECSATHRRADGVDLRIRWEAGLKVIEEG